MPWARFDDKFYAHPKTHRLGRHRLAAIGLHTLAVTWSCDQLTDGVIPTGVVTMLGGSKVVADALVEAGMWRWSGERDEYLIHDFLDYNKSRGQVERERAQWRDRQGKSRGGSRGVSRRGTKENARESLDRVARGLSTESNSPVPVPASREIESTGKREGEGSGERVSRFDMPSVGDVFGGKS